MSDFFSIVIRRMRLISTYDAAGNPLNEFVEHVDDVHNDVPATLCATWRRMYPDNVVSITRMAASDNSGERDASRGQKGYRMRQKAPPAGAAPRHEPLGGDGYAAAVTAVAKREARA